MISRTEYNSLIRKLEHLEIEDQVTFRKYRNTATYTFVGEPYQNKHVTEAYTEFRECCAGLNGEWLDGMSFKVDKEKLGLI